jgi:hypothetical protein
LHNFVPLGPLGEGEILKKMKYSQETLMQHRANSSNNSPGTAEKTVLQATPTNLKSEDSTNQIKEPHLHRTQGIPETLHG